MNDLIKFELKTYHVLLLILFIGLLLRINDIETKGLWMDEIHSAVAADPDWSLAKVIEYAEKDQPPLFFILLHSWYKVTSYSDYNGRILSILIGLIGIGAMFFLGKEYKDYKTGLMASFLTAVNYFHIDHSRQVRFYPLVFLLALLSFLFFIRCFKQKKITDFLLYTVFTALLLNTHYYGLVVFASQGLLFIVIVVWRKIWDVKFITASVISGIVALLSLSHWIPVITSDLQISEFHIQPVKWYFLVQYFYMYFRDPISCVISGLLLCVAIREIVIRFKSNSLKVEDLILVGWISLGYIIPLLYSVLSIPMLQDKYTFILVPGLLLLVALGFDRIKTITWSFYLVPLLFICVFVNALFFKKLYHIPHPPEQWREVTKEIIKSDKDTQLVFSEYAWYYRYYFKVYKSVNPPLEPAYANFNGLLPNANSIWVIQSTRLPDKGLQEAQQKVLNEEFELERTDTFIDARSIHYVRK